MTGSVGVLGGVGAVVGRRVGASAVLALWGCGGPWGGPAAVAVAGPLLCLPGLLAALPGVVAWPGSWRRAVLLVSGSCFRSGLFPNCIAGLRMYPDRFLRR